MNTRAALLVLSLAACASQPSVQVQQAPEFALSGGQPLRVAVLPFRDATPGHGLFWYLGRPLAWLGRLVTLDFGGAAPEAKDVAQVLRTLLVARLQSESVAVVNPSMVDASLARLGPEVAHGDPIALARALDVDAVLEGEVHRYGASYRLIDTTRQLEAAVHLRAAADGKELFSANVRVDDSAGLTHGPTGLVSLVAVPLAAVDSGPYTTMAIAWAEEVGHALLGGSLQSRGAQPPVLGDVQVVAAEHPLAAGDTIEVFAIGTADATAQFDVGSLHVEVPMFADGDVGDGQAHYRGIYTVTAADRAVDAPIKVRLSLPLGGVVTKAAQRHVDLAGR